jgi:hypothetical protein
VQGNVSPGPGEGSRIWQRFHHRKAQVPVQADDLANIFANLGWINVDPTRQLQPRPLDNVSCHSTADRAKSILDHSNVVWHQVNLSQNLVSFLP